jgi:dihydroorotate dehydrogenase/Pyruvate/2-oxoacid:ferredoxin oxidoreductase delta subunit
MNFLGCALNGHIVAASCPATENIENIKACAENGAAAIILKSASSTRLGDGATRRCHMDRTGFWAESGFDREIMPLDAAADLTRQAADTVRVPIIPSVTELTLELERWFESCETLCKAGANALQLDFFYLPNLLAENDFNVRFVTLLRELRMHCRVPVMPKLNIGIPVELALRLLGEAGIENVSVLDSIRSPAPYGAHLTGESLSVFGSFMLPITRRYTHALSKAGFCVCAGGGVANAEEAAELISLGAKTVQIASEVLLNGFSRLGEIDREIPMLLLSRKPQPEIRPRKAVFSADKCVGCGKCGIQAFCTVAKTLHESADGCEGCGLCALRCENGAIKLESAGA